MLSTIITILIGAAFGAAMGYFGQCSSGACPLTSTWWRGALYGAFIGLLVSLVAGSPFGNNGQNADETNVKSVVDPSQFDSLVLKSQQPVIVDFYATWCPPCRRLSPIIAKLANEYAGKVNVIKVDIDKGTKLANQYRISAVPTLMGFKDGKQVFRLEGAPPEAEMKKYFESLNAKTEENKK
ncbi:MAG: thioredoxin [Verrucomicrobiia bacterium]